MLNKDQINTYIHMKAFLVNWVGGYEKFDKAFIEKCTDYTYKKCIFCGKKDSCILNELSNLIECEGVHTMYTLTDLIMKMGKASEESAIEKINNFIQTDPLKEF